MTQYLILHTWPGDNEPSIMPCVFDNEAEALVFARTLGNNDHVGHAYTVAHVPGAMHVSAQPRSLPDVAARVAARDRHLISPTCDSGYCTTVACQGAVQENPATGRWFITMGHPGFNCPANNRDGFLTRARAEAAYRRYAGIDPPFLGPGRERR